MNPCDLVLHIVHWIVLIILVASSVLFGNWRNANMFSYIMVIGIFMSWLLFRRCILWDLQRKVNPEFDPRGDTTSSMVRMDPHTWNKITASLMYINFYFLGRKLKMGDSTLLMIILYLLLNGQYTCSALDNMEKYII